jgi:arylsulfatase A-like enzyme
MTRSWVVVLGAAIAVIACSDRSGTPSEARPNVVLIVVDTLRADVLGCYGSPLGLSPAIDRLAADGVVFSTALCPSPITAPSHASLMTSRLPSELGVLVNSRTELPPSVPVLAELLRDAGYETAAAVAIGPLEARWGFDRGFGSYDDRFNRAWLIDAGVVLDRTRDLMEDLDEPFLLWSQFGDPHEPYRAHGLVDRTADLVVDGRTVTTLSTSHSLADVYPVTLSGSRGEIVLRSDDPFVVRKFILRRRGVFRSYLRPRWRPDPIPLDPVRELRIDVHSRYGNRLNLYLRLDDVIESQDAMWERYRREVVWVDRHVGAVVDLVRSRGLYDDSLIIITADHGEALGDHGHIGHVEYLYESQVRVPLIVKLPQNLAAGDRRHDLVTLLDVLPTIMARTGVSTPHGARGRDLFAAEAELADRVAFLETHAPQASTDRFGLRAQDTKVIWTPMLDLWELYRIDRDPEEQQNLAAGSPDLLQPWRAELELLLSSLSPVPGTEAIPLDEKTRQQLRELGYLRD